MNRITIYISNVLLKNILWLSETDHYYIIIIECEKCKENSKAINLYGKLSALLIGG